MLFPDKGLVSQNDFSSYKHFCLQFASLRAIRTLYGVHVLFLGVKDIDSINEMFLCDIGDIDFR